MKRIYTISCLLFALVASSLIAQTREEVLKMWDDPKPYLEVIRDGIKNSGDTTWENNSKLGDRIRGLAYAINQEIIHAESKDWANPSPARSNVIKKWGAILEPYTKELLTLAMEERKTRYDSSTQARSILDFASPTEALATQVREYIVDTNYRSTSEAADLLFEHRLLSEADRKIIRESMASIEIEQHKIVFAQDMHRYGITDWDQMLIENAKINLESKPKSNKPDDIVDFYGLAINTARLLKTKAHILSPALDALVDYMEKNCPRCIPFVKSAKDSVLGLSSDNFDPELAKNGSGPLTVKIGDLTQQNDQDDQPRRDASHERPENYHTSAASKSSDVTAQEKASFPWLTMVSLIGLLALLFVGWLKFRKAKHTP